MSMTWKGITVTVALSLLVLLACTACDKKDAYWGCPDAPRPGSWVVLKGSGERVQVTEIWDCKTTYVRMPSGRVFGFNAFEYELVK